MSDDADTLTRGTLRRILGVISVVLLSGFVALGVALSRSPRLVAVDQVLSEAVRGACGPLARSVAAAFSWLGEWPGMTVLSAIVVVTLLLGGRRRLAWWFPLTVFTAWAACEAAKVAFARARPAGVALIDLPSSASYPSGHATSSTAYAAALLLVLALTVRRPTVRWLGAAAAALFAAGVAFSRVCLGVHFVGDVLGGVSLGSGWALGCAVLFGLAGALEAQREGRAQPDL